MRASQAAAAASPTTKAAPDSANDNPADQASSDAETEVLPFSDNEDDADAAGHASAKMDIDDDTSQAQAPIVTADPSAHDAAAAALAGLGEVAAEASPAADDPTKAPTASPGNFSSDSDLSDAPDEVAADANDAQDDDEDDDDDDADADGQSDGGSTLSEDSGAAVAEGQALQANQANDSDSDDALGGDDDDDMDDDEEQGNGNEGDNDDDDDEDEDDDDEEDAEDQRAKADAHKARPGGGRRARQELRDAVLAQDAAAGEEREEEEDAASSLAALAGGATNVEAEGSDDEAQDTLADRMPEMGSKTAAAAALRSRKPSIMGPQILIDPADESPSVSRQVSPEAMDEDTGGPNGEEADDDDVDAADAKELAIGDKAAAAKREAGLSSEETSKDEQLQTGTDTAAGTPPAEQPEPEEDTATDEAAMRRTEALDALAKVEIKVALLRDRLYIERAMEIAREQEMILDGTHPELIHVTAIIEARRVFKIRTLETWYEEEQRHFAKMAAAESREAHLTWRAETADLRRDAMEEWSTKRRKLEREKRNIDAPRPARRHQVFETELIGEPELAAAAARAAKMDRAPGAVGKRRAYREAKELAELGSHIALPDLHGLEDYEAWGDLERMGILRPDPRLGHAMAAGPGQETPQLHSGPRHPQHGQQPPEMGFHGQPGASGPGSTPHSAWAGAADQQPGYGPPPGRNVYAPTPDMYVYGGAPRPGEVHPDDMYAAADHHMYDPAYGMQHRHESPPQAFAPESSRAGRHTASSARNRSRPPPPPPPAQSARHDAYGRPLSPPNGDARYAAHPADAHPYARSSGAPVHHSPMDRPVMLHTDERDVKPFINGHARPAEYEAHRRTPPGHFAQPISPARRQAGYNGRLSEEAARPRGSRAGARHDASPRQQDRPLPSTAAEQQQPQIQQQAPSPRPRHRQESPTQSRANGSQPIHTSAGSGHPSSEAEREQERANAARADHSADAPQSSAASSRAPQQPKDEHPREALAAQSAPTAASSHHAPPAGAAAVAAAFASSPPASSGESTQEDQAQGPSAAKSGALTASQGASKGGATADAEQQVKAVDGDQADRPRPSSSSSTKAQPELAHRLPLSSEAEQQVAEEDWRRSGLSARDDTSAADGTSTPVKQEDDASGQPSLRAGSVTKEGPQKDEKTLAGPSSTRETSTTASTQLYPPKPY